MSLTKAQIKNLSAIGITGVKTEEEARKKLIAFLAKHDLEATPADSLNDMIEWAEAFATNDEEELVEESEEVELPKKSAKKKAIKQEVEEEEETEREVETDELEEAPKAKKKVSSEKKEKKTPKPKGVRFFPFEEKDDKIIINPEHDALLNPLRTFFKDTNKYQVTPLANGVSVFILAKNSKIIIFSLKNGAVVNGDVHGVLWNNRFKDEKTFFEATGLEEDSVDDVVIGVHTGDPLVTMRRISIKQWVKLLKETDLVKANLEQVNSLDIKMGKNREKLEESLKKGVKAPKVVDTNDEEEAPVKKAPAKKSAVVAKKK